MAACHGAVVCYVGKGDRYKMGKSKPRNILIVGGSRGIGRKISELFAENGDSVFFTYHSNHQNAAETKARLIEFGSSNTESFSFDAGKIEALSQYEKISGKYGPFDVLVNCAGITRDRSLKKMTFEDWHAVIQTNLYSVFMSCKALLPFMMETGFGRIVNISSIIGQTGSFGQSNYAASKAAIIGFTKSLALECAKYDITANVVCPGFINTDMTAGIPQDILQKISNRIPKGTFGEVEDIANMVEYLARSDSGYITGQVMNINGGLYM